jgi:hypothetical protein
VSFTAYILGIIASVSALIIVIEMLRRRRLRERHAVWWILAGILAVIVGIFPAILSSVAALVGIEVPTNLVFFVSIAVLFFVCIQNSAELTGLETKTRALAEESALLELRIRTLEANQELPRVRGA